MNDLAEFDKWKEVNSTIDQHREWVVSVTGTSTRSKRDGLIHITGVWAS